MRSLLFVPGHDERKLNKGLGSEADALILDLEDAVPPAEKARAREVTSEFLRAHPQRRCFVRVNALDTGLLLADLAAVIQARPYGIMLPKCTGTADIATVSAYLLALEAREQLAAGATRLLPIVTENAASLLNMHGYAQHENPRLCGMLWGGEDLATDVGVPSNRSGDGRYTALFQLARSLTLLSAAAARVAAVDAVYTDFRNPQGLRAECEEAKRDGYTAKAAIHPDQVAVINEVFSPSQQELDRARQVIAAFDAQPEAGSISIDGKMLDRPHYTAALRVVNRAQP